MHVNKILSSGAIPLPGMINELPDDVFLHLLSFLNIYDLQSDAVVAKGWSIATIKVIRGMESNLIINFCRSLATHLNPEDYSDQIAKIQAIGSDRKILTKVNLIDIKTSILKIREDLLEILKTLEKDDLDDLNDSYKKQRKPREFDNIFRLAKFCLAIDKAKITADPRSKNKSLASAAVGLAEFAHFTKAVEVADTILDENQKSYVYMQIAIFLAKIGNIDKAIEIAPSIKGAKLVDIALAGITLAAITQENFDMAIKAVNSIPASVEKKNSYFSTIETSKSNPDTLLKRHLADHLIEIGYLDKATQVVKTIPNNEQGEKTVLLRQIIALWQQRGISDKAVAVAKLLPHDDEENE